MTAIPSAHPCIGAAITSRTLAAMAPEFTARAMCLPSRVASHDHRGAPAMAAMK